MSFKYVKICDLQIGDIIDDGLNLSKVTELPKFWIWTPTNVEMASIKREFVSGFSGGFRDSLSAKSDYKVKILQRKPQYLNNIKQQ